jgi:hypothetical protein
VRREIRALRLDHRMMSDIPTQPKYYVISWPLPRRKCCGGKDLCAYVNSCEKNDLS